MLAGPIWLQKHGPERAYPGSWASKIQVKGSYPLSVTCKSPALEPVMELSKPQFINLYNGNYDKISDENFRRLKKFFYENTLGKST